MGWLENQYKEQEKKIHKLNPQKGDFVNLSAWFGDVWAEVLAVYEPDNIEKISGSLVIANYRGNRYDTNYIFYYQIRMVVKRDELNMKMARIIYTKDCKYSDVFSRHPGNPVEEFFGGIRASMRYRLVNTKGVAVYEAKRIDTIKRLWAALDNRELLILKDVKTKISMLWSDM